MASTNYGANYGANQTGAAMQNAQNGMSAPEKGSRINSDVDRVLNFVKTTHRARDRVLRQTSALGYFSNEATDTPDSSGAKVSPISNNLQSALADLDRALDGLHNALGLFE